MFTSRRFGGTPPTSRPRRRIWPASGSSNPATMRIVVVFPHPDGPSSVRNSPSWTSREIPRTASIAPKDFRTSRRLIATSAPERSISAPPTDDLAGRADLRLQPALRQPPPHLRHDDDGPGQDHHDDGDGDHRRQVLRQAHLREKVKRERRGLPGDERRDHDLVERDHEGDQERGHQRGREQWHRDRSEGGERGRSQIASGLLVGDRDPLQTRDERQDRERQGDHDVTDRDRQRGELDPEPVEDDQQRDPEHDEGDHEGRQQQPHHEALRGEPAPDQRDRGRDREDRRGHRGDRCDHATRGERPQERVVREEGPVPAEREALPGERNGRAVVEREHDQHGDRRVEEHDEDPEHRPESSPAVPGRGGVHSATVRTFRYRPKTTISRATARTRNIDIAEPNCQSKPWRNAPWIALPKKNPLGPPTKSGVTYSPIVGMKTNAKAAITPGMDSGSVTVRKVVHRPAPRSVEASSSDRSIVSRDTKIGRATNGTPT